VTIPVYRKCILRWCSAVIVAILAHLAALSTQAHAQPAWDPVSGCYISSNGVPACNGYPGSGPGQAQGPRIGYDPCFLAQNAMRPCGSDQVNAAKPVGVDSNLVGTWQLPLKSGSWLLTIGRDGTYKFRGEGPNHSPPRAGTFFANNGHWSLKTADGYTDAGLYLYQAPDIWIATGKLGAAAWRRPASTPGAVPSCTSHQPSKTSSLDGNLVGTWKLPLKGGPWIWEILQDGSYKFHSEARDGAPSHAGTFSAKEGNWSLNSTTGYNDAGYYLYQSPDVLIAAGKLGAAAWVRSTAESASCH
jgi:hypothetical protein